MTIRTINTNMEEAEKILKDKVRFVFRSNREFIQEGDVIQFLVIKDKRPITMHKLNSLSFVVTDVRDDLTAPIEKGLQIIGFRRLK